MANFKAYVQEQIDQNAQELIVLLKQMLRDMQSKEVEDRTVRRLALKKIMEFELIHNSKIRAFIAKEPRLSALLGQISLCWACNRKFRCRAH